MEGNFAGLTAASFPLFIEIKNEENGLTFADATLSQQIELILESSTPVEVIQQPPPRSNTAIIDDDDDSNIELGDLLKYNKKIEDDKEPAEIVEVTCSKSTEVYNCAECSESFDTKEIYDIHMSGHANNMKCAICNMVLKSLKNYEKHCLRCKPYECQICGRVVRFRPNFIKHMRVHTTQQSQRHKYKCEVCHKEFMSFEYFKVHKKIHNGNINLTCGVCGKVFSALASLRGHSKLHTGIKLHKCDICGKGFGQRYNLKIHSRVHTGETPFECKICKRKLHTHSSLQTHMQTHHNEKESSIIDQVDQVNNECVTTESMKDECEDKIDEEEFMHAPEIVLAEMKGSPPSSDELLPAVTITIKQEDIGDDNDDDDDNDNDDGDDDDAAAAAPAILATSAGTGGDAEKTLNTLNDHHIKIENTIEESSKINKVITTTTEDEDNDHSTTVTITDVKYQTDFECDLVDSSNLTTSLSYSNLFDPGSIPQSIPDDIYMDDNDSSFQLEQNSMDLQSSTTDGNFIKKEWVYSNYTVGQKFDDDDLCEAASFIYD